MQGTLQYAEVEVAGFEAEGSGKAAEPYLGSSLLKTCTRYCIKLKRSHSTLRQKNWQHKKKGECGQGFDALNGGFLQTYFFKPGLLDGRAGFTIAVYNFVYTYFNMPSWRSAQQGWKEPVAPN